MGVEYTHGKFWGGTVLPYWVFLLCTTIPFIGFFGIDHLLFYSTSTALAKFITNICTFGLWYFYDILQAFGDKEYIEKYGLSIPIFGAKGLALDFFRGIGKDSSTKESSNGIISVISFIAFVFTLLMPYGISHFIAGDMNGGIVKFILSCGIIWIPFFIIGGAIQLFSLLTKPEDVFNEGVSRGIPLNFFMSSTGIASRVMTPSALEIANNKPGEPGIISSLLSFFGLPNPMEIIDTTKCTVVPPIEKTIHAASEASKGIAGLAKTVPEIGKKATETLSAFSDKNKLLELASSHKQSGGSLITNNVFTDFIIIGGISLLIIGGFGASFFRHYQNRKPINVTINDPPPNPRTT